MIYIAIDVETTGLDFYTDQVLEVGAILEDTSKKLSFEEIPKFHCLVRHDNYYFSNEYALALNSWIFDEFVKEESKYNILYKENVAIEFNRWIVSNTDDFEKITVAGKNPEFDKRFLQNLPLFKDLIQFRNRHLDPTILYTDFENDTVMPNLGLCKHRAGWPNKVSHKAMDDAWDVIQLLRKHY